MLLFVGLGNPGTKYSNNRHNIGFMAVDEIIHRHSFSAPKEKFQAQIYEGRIEGEKVMAIKPLTYMNLSGQAIGEIARFYKIPSDDIYVFYDELDLAPSKVKYKTGGGAGGHNGIKSLDQHIDKNYHRIRIGIGHPGREQVTGHVLSDFSKADQKWLEEILYAISYASSELVSQGGVKFLNKLGTLLKPNKKNPKKEQINKTN